MWCSSCHQDVPAIVHPVGKRNVCARCQRPLKMPESLYAVGILDTGIALDDGPVVIPPPPARRLDDWQAEQRVRHLGRSLRRASIATQPANKPPLSRRFDPPQDLLGDVDLRTRHQGLAVQRPTITPSAARPSESGQAVAWLLVVVGSLLLFAGLGTIGWSLATTRTDFWNVAIGLTLSGQGTLIFGLAIVVSRLWRNSRYATGRLHDVHARLGQLQCTADALAAMRGGAPAFYAELVRGASPQTLVSNLRGQLDQLATRVGSAS